MEDYRFSTPEPHADNGETMDVFLGEHFNEVFSQDAEVVLVDGTYAEVIDEELGQLWEVHAGGDGDFNNHRIKFKKIYDGKD